MRIYVAAKFEEKPRVRTLMRALEDAGHQITLDWTDEDATGLTGMELQAYYAECAENDVRGVQRAEVFVVLDHPRGRGLFVELGVALAKGAHVIVVGVKQDDPDNCIFYYFPWMVHVETEDQVLAAVEKIRKENEFAA